MLYRAYSPASVSHSCTTADKERLARLHFHIQTGDYFSMLSTMLGFVEETLTEFHPAEGTLPGIEKSLLQSVRKDLLDLQENYRIEPRDSWMVR